MRAEYPLAIDRLEIALSQARERGYLGKNLFGTNFSFDIRIKAGAGAFVCGEETALIASLEGERGMPRLKPPFPAQKGYWKKPTDINNVESFANVPWIINNGGAAFAAMGTEKSKGTKVKKGGLVEVPMGLPIKDVIYGTGGGIKNDKKFKAVQMGGPSGGCIPADLADTPVDYESINKTGAIVGSGGMIVMDEDTCMVDMARYFLDFTRKVITAASERSVCWRSWSASPTARAETAISSCWKSWQTRCGTAQCAVWDRLPRIRY